MQECKHSAPGARLSAKLRAELERLTPDERASVVRRQRDGSAPLFVASRRGNLEIVEYLVHVCCADLEQRGVFEVPEDRSVHVVTPLWAACVVGRLEVAKVLLDAGAEVDAPSDSGSTPVRSACFMTHLDVVQLLVSRGADIARPNHNGGTCLINAVQSPALVAYLLEQGAPVNASDLQLKTALHYAIGEHRIDTVRLLLDKGADPKLKSRHGDCALRTACLKGAAPIVALLLSHDEYSCAYAQSQGADAYELLGATSLDEFNDVAAALNAWRKATFLRHSDDGIIEKLPRRRAHPALLGVEEWVHPHELEQMSADVDALRLQSLLVVNRILGPSHRDTVFRLMYRGASYADALRYQRCIDLWSWALAIRVRQDSVLLPDTCHTACALTRVMLDLRSGRIERLPDQDGASVPRHSDVLRVFKLLAGDLPASRRALDARPVSKKQADSFDRALRCVTHLIFLLLDTAQTEHEKSDLNERLRKLLAQDVRSAHTGDSLLHLCVSRLNVIRSTYFADELAPVAPVFPSVAVVRVLLSCGASASARNAARSTPLHVAAVPYNFSSALVEALLQGGAHLDQPNRFGDAPSELVALNRGSTVRPLLHVTLACLAARALLREPAYARQARDGVLPASLMAFVELHRV